MHAIHHPGGNHFNDMRIDISASISRQDEWLATLPRTKVGRSWLASKAALARYRVLRRLGLWEPCVNAGLEREWFEEFLRYWSACLGGRPLFLIDFFQLYFHYRCRFQGEERLSWQDSAEHLANWQQWRGIYAILHGVYRGALYPVRSGELLEIVRPGMRILEYGCGTAPMYRTWRRFSSHVPTQWTLADIPGYSYHYARQVLGADDNARFVTIDQDHFDDPLHAVRDDFDLIIVQEVFEHLDHPLRTARYLINRLKRGGLLYFDYVKSDAVNLDTPQGLEEREDTLRLIAGHCELLRGSLDDTSVSVGRCLARRRLS